VETRVWGKGGGKGGKRGEKHKGRKSEKRGEILAPLLKGKKKILGGEFTEQSPRSTEEGRGGGGKQKDPQRDLIWKDSAGEEETKGVGKKGSDEWSKWEDRMRGDLIL